MWQASQAETGFFRLPGRRTCPCDRSQAHQFGTYGIPIRLTVTVHPADRNQLAVNFGYVPEDVVDRRA
jgi:hypothetical protein